MNKHLEKLAQKGLEDYINDFNSVSAYSASQSGYLRGFREGYAAVKPLLTAKIEELEKLILNKEIVHNAIEQHTADELVKELNNILKELF